MQNVVAESVAPDWDLDSRFPEPYTTLTWMATGWQEVEFVDRRRDSHQTSKNEKSLFVVSFHSMYPAPG